MRTPAQKKFDREGARLKRAIQAHVRFCRKNPLFGDVRPKRPHGERSRHLKSLIQEFRHTTRCSCKERPVVRRLTNGKKVVRRELVKCRRCLMIRQAWRELAELLAKR
jgi:hypothetical protein